MKKKLIIVFSAVILLILAAVLTAAVLLPGKTVPTPELKTSPEIETGAPSLEIPSEQSETEPPPEVKITNITLSFVGDCMLATDRGGEYAGSFNALANSVDPSYFFQNFIELFKSDDWTIANLENVFTDSPEAYTVDKGYTPAYWYKSKTANTAILTAGSIEVVSLANNHSDDYGKIGAADTRAALDTAGVIWGDNDKIVTLEKDGFTIAVYCTTFYYNGYDKIIMDKLDTVEADYKIVYFHGGTERVHVPDAWKAAGCRRMIDRGADIVIGGHPHVLQPVEIYKGKTIVHSLGNFVFGGSRGEENRTMVYRLYLTVTDGVVTAESDEIIPCYLYSDAYKPAVITDEADKQAVFDFLDGNAESPIVK